MHTVACRLLPSDMPPSHRRYQSHHCVISLCSPSRLPLPDRWLTDVQRRPVPEGEEKVHGDEDGPPSAEDDLEDGQQREVSDEDPLSDQEGRPVLPVAGARVADVGTHDPVVAWRRPKL